MGHEYEDAYVSSIEVCVFFVSAAPLMFLRPIVALCASVHRVERSEQAPFHRAVLCPFHVFFTSRWGSYESTLLT